MQSYYLGLGSNIGERESLLSQAIALIGERVGEVVACSSMYETEADGFTSENRFMNAVVAVSSYRTPHDVLRLTHEIELDLGCTTHRNPDGSYCDRTLDIDLIACDDVVCDDDTLTLPHPRMHLRSFVLDPLCEIAPHWVHPILRKSAQALRSELG